MANKRYMDVDVLAMLEEKMKSNTKHYQSDFELDKHLLTHYADSPFKEDKTVLWMSRAFGTWCHTEHDAFIRYTQANSTWRYYAEQAQGAPILACAVELTGRRDGVIRGNVYELDYPALAERIKEHSVPLLEFERTFEDGYVAHVPPERSSAPFYRGLVKEHGEITATRCIPTDREQLSTVLAAQKALRDKLKLGHEPLKMNSSIKKWYQVAFPDDELGASIEPNVTFASLYDDMTQGISVYASLGHDADSIIRERVFSQLAALKGVDYQNIYDLWLEAPKTALTDQISAAGTKAAAKVKFEPTKEPEHSH